ncbi:YdcF family protein [Oscillatoria sp. FACHB-1406]|uniref:YdcF family protein n=1 Tax=Oscillatoria sp. FACHB-1406 TaxID=2692846 RepID=UPI00168910C9|nr:YdcF family protein [Oscillatoria sp. FACHB-1406]MBD2578801.1 YdcF family protein [Oscillatoria sp. FACHB-1406]
MSFLQARPFKIGAIGLGVSLGMLLIGLAATILIGNAIARQQAPTPQAILMLGGNLDREAFTATFARQHPQLKIWVSSGLPRSQASQIFSTAGIASDRVYLDYQAVDTVTNFSTLVGELKKHSIRHVYLVTSTYHMRRAKAIATLILGSQGIAFTPLAVPSRDPAESWLQVARDTGRAALWVFTGRTAATLNPKYYHLRDVAERDSEVRYQ